MSRVSPKKNYGGQFPKNHDYRAPMIAKTSKLMSYEALEDLSLRSALLPTESVNPPAFLSPSENHPEPKSEKPLVPPTKEFSRTLNFKLRDQELHTEWLKLLTSFQSAPKFIWDQEMDSFRFKNLRNLLQFKRLDGSDGIVSALFILIYRPIISLWNSKQSVSNTAVERFLTEEQPEILASKTENQKKEWPIKRKQLLRRSTWFLNGFRPPLRSLAGFAIGLLLSSFSAQKVSAATSGPDAFSYRDKASSEPAGPVFSFEGISGSGAVPIDSEHLFATPSVQIRAVSDHFSTPSPSQP